MYRWLVIAIGFCLWGAPGFAQEPAQTEADAAPPAEEGYYYGVAVLQGLNKVTARISKLEAPVGASIRFGNLEIIVKRCWKALPTEEPENAAFMEIWERKPDEEDSRIFHGWMFSSSPSLSDLEHPVYDVTVLSCDKRELGDKT